LTIWWCPENFMMISLMVQKLPCWPMCKETETDKVRNRHCKNNTIFAVLCYLDDNKHKSDVPKHWIANLTATYQ